MSNLTRVIFALVFNVCPTTHTKKQINREDDDGPINMSTGEGWEVEEKLLLKRKPHLDVPFLKNKRVKKVLVTYMWQKKKVFQLLHF